MKITKTADLTERVVRYQISETDVFDVLYDDETRGWFVPKLVTARWQGDRAVEFGLTGPLEADRSALGWVGWSVVYRPDYADVFDYLDDVAGGVPWIARNVAAQVRIADPATGEVG